ncbi:MAG: hypothetical protein SVU32_06535, partial [Candidatus Nanohaloarchaea archaeon]|nr:hypothetical protein [Candidatus Nanohaloarchaea archaeon]
PSIIPLVVGLLVIELYFGKYDLAHHDWDDAVANTTMVITSALTLIHDLKLWKTPFQGASRVAFGILGGGAVILFLNFFPAGSPSTSPRS